MIFKRFWFPGSVLTLLLAALMGVASAQPISVTVSNTAKQQFAGFGLVASDPEATIKALEQPNGGWRMLALPVDLKRLSPQQGERDFAAFTAAYLDTGVLAAAKAAGIESLVLLPSGVPDYMLANTPTPAAEGERPLVYEFVPKYALLLADVIANLKQQGVGIGFVSVAAQTPHITPDQWTAVVKYLKAILNARQISVALGAIAWPVGEPGGNARLAALRQDAEAWQMVDFGIATLPFSLQNEGEAIGVDGKPFWLLANENSKQEPQLFLRGLNLGATTWLTAPSTLSGQLARRLPPHTRFYATKCEPGVQTAAALRKDGTWVICVAAPANFKADSQISVSIEVLSGKPDSHWSVLQFNATPGEPSSYQAVMHEGQFNLTVQPDTIVIAESR